MSWAGHVDRMGRGEAYTGFPSDGSGRQICTTIGKRRLYTKVETIQEHRIYKLENKKIQNKQQT